MPKANAKSAEIPPLRKKYIEQGIIVPAKKGEKVNPSKAYAKSSEILQTQKKQRNQGRVASAKKDEPAP
jgi:hypothetical protein